MNRMLFRRHHVSAGCLFMLFMGFAGLLWGCESVVEPRPSVHEEPEFVDLETAAMQGATAFSSVPLGGRVRFDIEPAWPLCGRITENAPKGWSESQGCPAKRWGNSLYHDAPFSSTYGPRQLASEGYRYDFHRGLDIPAEEGTPLFAIADGKVLKAGSYSSYTDPLIQVQHKRPGYKSCSGGGGCYTSHYMHVSGWVVSEGDTVAKGDLIGYSGVSSAGQHAHLHFEIRDAPGKHDATSRWSRDAIHPLTVLPYPDTGTSNLSVSVDNLDTSKPANPTVSVRVTMPMSAELDLRRVEVQLYRLANLFGQSTWVQVAQSGDQPVGTTMDLEGYYVNPSWYDMVATNRQYTYKNSTAYPWSAFETSGVYESPYASSLPSSYSENVHMDQALSTDPQVGAFNGVELAPDHYNASSSQYSLSLTFKALDSAALPGTEYCAKARALDVKGNATAWESVGCKNALRGGK